MDFKKFSKLIMIEQTLFALPFALIGVLFAGGGTVMTWFWVMVALAAARTAGMSFNRLIDAEIDAKNPRTSDRPLPKGDVQPGVVWITACLSSFILIGASFMLNRLCFYLSFPAVFMLFTYSYFKRFSASSHFYLGLVEAAAPIGGYIAVTGEFTRVPFVLGFIIMAWIAGLDIVYAIQDMEFDVKENLHSMPVRFGKKRALVISTGCYLVSISAMIYAGFLTQKTIPYWTAVVLVGIIFFYQQRLARSKNISLAIRNFFKANIYISPILFFGTLTDVFIGKFL
ncbi:MAG: 4-hydroxybenzoate octaprenyltransferase [Deltaproteobacteria bacterium]|nr:4-hydroxybenzoate octaprenyltransferase [Deltaproteobacteria bacterium]MBW2015031.1 4-hydroxybenzoate octaprenyltransferase [Deltaproteobacteria bacterium]MBW2320378.1 4-hydroxybenzoate octaprenyltransferase [Deltaproteobacteria bacterium]